MRKNKKGFTLIELVVVTVIMGILASIALPMYQKTVEVSKASDAVAIGHLLGGAYRMYLVDNPTALTGSVTGAAGTGCNTGACDVNDTTACRLVRCNYVAQQNWDGGAYSYSVGGGLAASIRRRTTPPGGTTAAPYSSWGYDFNLSGGCAPVGAAPSCPNF